MHRSIVRLAVLALSLASLNGCIVNPADDTDAESIQASSAALAATAGVTASATYQEVVTGTPTYGSPATTPVLTIRVDVDDASLKGQFPGFNGLESAFALVPKLKNGSVAWESVSLSWKGTTLKGYYGEIKIDIHESGSIYGVDWSTLQANGVAVGLTTNMGTIWGQNPGANWPVTKK